MPDLRIRELMTTGVYTIRPEAPVAGLHNFMNAKRIRHMPVVDDDGVLVGLVSQHDVLRCTFPLDEDMPMSARTDRLATIRVGDIMTEEVETVQADEALVIAARRMLAGKYGCLPVIEDGVLAGIITEGDFVRLIAGSVGELAAAADDDGGDDDQDDGDDDDEGDESPGR